MLHNIPFAARARKGIAKERIAHDVRDHHTLQTYALLLPTIAGSAPRSGRACVRGWPGHFGLCDVIYSAAMDDTT